MASLSDFVVSKVRVKLLEVFLVDPEQMFYIRELTRKIGEEINAVRRELIHMQSVGMVKDEKRGNRIYYTFNKNYLQYNTYHFWKLKKININNNKDTTINPQ